MSRYHGIGRRGGEEELWPVTIMVSDLGERTSSRLFKRGHIFNGLRYPHPWDISFEVVWRKGWRGWHLGWAFETVGYNNEQYGVSFYLLPFTLYLHLDTHGILPKPTQEREWKLIAMFGEGVATDVSVHYRLGPGGINSPWKDKQGRRVGGVWSLLDWLFGRNAVAEHRGEPYPLTVVLPERSYNIIATSVERTWSRPRWPHWPLVIRHRTADIDASGDPLPDPGNDESDFYDGEDATFGTGVEDGTPREVAQRVAERVMAERRRHGAGLDWRPTRDWRPQSSPRVDS
jgi:hypothetical protein